MHLVLLATEERKAALLNNWHDQNVAITPISNPASFLEFNNADGFIDLSFDGSGERIELLRKISVKPVIINSVIQTTQQINAPVIRINGWPGFLDRPVLEASAADKNMMQQVDAIFFALGKKAEWLPDEPGFITARVIAMIINEAWFALGEKISTSNEIDAAMRLGTNYPYGPFEWCEKIGPKNIYNLLNELAKKNSRYTPAGLLQKQVLG